MPLFKIDDRKVKEIIKDVVGSKEGDFNGQSMMCGTTVNPVVIINDLDLKYKYIIATDIANGQTVKFFDGLAKVVMCGILQSNTETNDKNFTFSCESLGGLTYSTQVAVSNNSQKYIMLNGEDGGYFNITGDLHNFGVSVDVPVKDFRVSQDSADGTAQVIKIKVWYIQ